MLSPDNGNMPSVTVVVSAYNEARNIAMCVDSILTQTLLPESIVVVDDGSTDETVKVLGRYAGDPRVNIVALPRNVGVPGARNLGVAHSGSDIIAFLDADAFAPSEWLANLVTPMADHSVFATGGPDRAPVSGKPFALAVDYSMRSWIATGRLRLNNPFLPFAPSGCNFAIRRSILNELGGFDERLNRRGEEKELIHRLQRIGCGIAYCDRALIRHHRRVSQKQFWRQNYLSGRARVDILRLTPHAFDWPHMLPAVLVIAMLLAAGHFVASGGEGSSAWVLGSYFFLLVIDGLIATFVTHILQAALWVPLTTATIHWGYGIGLIVGGLRWLLGHPVGGGSVRPEPDINASPK